MLDIFVVLSGFVLNAQICCSFYLAVLSPHSFLSEDCDSNHHPQTVTDSVRGVCAICLKVISYAGPHFCDLRVGGTLRHL